MDDYGIQASLNTSHLEYIILPSNKSIQKRSAKQYAQAEHPSNTPRLRMENFVYVDGGRNTCTDKHFKKKNNVLGLTVSVAAHESAF